MQATFLAINAGNDLILYGGGFGADASKKTDELYQNMTTLAKESPQIEQKILLAATRIAKLKAKIQ